MPCVTLETGDCRHPLFTQSAALSYFSPAGTACTPGYMLNFLLQ